MPKISRFLYKSISKSLSSFKSDGKVPKGLKIRSVTAKGRNTKHLPQTFDGILREAASKPLHATIETLEIKEQKLRDVCIEKKQKVVTSIEASPSRVLF